MTVMNEARFMVLLGAYGADLSRWPEDDRDNAGAFLESAPTFVCGGRQASHAAGR